MKNKWSQLFYFNYKPMSIQLPKSGTILFMTLCLVILSGLSNAQILTNQNITVSISNSTTLFASGGITNTGSTIVQNDGTLQLTGDFIHNGAPAGITGNGNFIFSGANQQIYGNTVLNFPSLTINGTGVKTLLSNIQTGGSSQSGTLSLINSTLDMNNFNIGVMNPSTTGIQYTNGSIKCEDIDFSSILTWNIGSAPGIHTVPFCNAIGTIIPFSFQSASGNPGTVSFSTYATAPSNLPLPINPVTVTHIRNNSGVNNSANTVDRFWYIDWTNTTAMANLIFTYAPGEVPANGNISPKAQRWNALNDGWQAPLPGQTNPGMFSTAVPNVNIPGIWALANNGSPLPITLLYFSATPNSKNEVELAWATLNERDNDYFTIERSINGTDFEEISRTAGAGNSNNNRNYFGVDKHPYTGRSYYRLRQTDFNGNFTLTMPQAVYIRNEGTVAVNIFPNPATDQINFFFSRPIESGNIEIYDLEGKLVFTTGEQKIITSSGILEIPVNGFARGIYSYRIKMDASIITQGKIVLR